MALTHERLRELLEYDANTGKFTRLRRTSPRAPVGAIAGTERKDGYVQISIDKRFYQAHRLAWFYVHGGWPPHQIDHINGKPGDNRIANLRPATFHENAQNNHGPMCRNKSGLVGVSWHKSGMWRSRVMLSGKVYQRYHRTPQEAHAAYLEAKAQLHPFSTLG